MAAQPKDIPVVKEADASGADTSYLSQSAPSPRSADFSFSSPMLLNLMMASSPPTRRAGRSDSTSSSNGINGFDQPSGSTLGRSAGAASSVSTSPPLTPPDISGADTVTIPTSPMSAQTPATDSKASDYNYFWTRHGRRASADASVHLPEQQSPTGVANWLSRLPKTSTLASPPLGSPTSPKDSFNLLSRFGVGNSKSGAPKPAAQPSVVSSSAATLSPMASQAATTEVPQSSEQRGRTNTRRPSIVRKLTPMSREMINGHHQF